MNLRWLAAIVALGCVGMSQPSWGEPCRPDSFAIDTTGAIRSIAAMWGEAPGQTFEARDTLISSISVWRRAEQAVNISEMKLWIVRVDSTGRPRSDQVVYEGPVIGAQPGDGIHPIEIRFDLDPPASLPGPGKFGFFVQNQCNWFFDLLVREPDSYSHGEAWRSEIAIYNSCMLRGIFDRFDHDLCCRIGFCSSHSTAT